MRWDGERQYGSHTEKATAGHGARSGTSPRARRASSSRICCSPIPKPRPTSPTVDWLLEGAAPVQRTYNLPPNSRTTISAGADAGTRRPVVRHRGQLRRAGRRPSARCTSARRRTCSSRRPQIRRRATRPSTSWFLAEGATGPFFETFILLANPNATPVDGRADVPADSRAPPSTRTVTIPARGALTVNIEALSPAAPELANAAVATQVTATLPIIVERAQYWPDAPSSGTRRTTASA